MKNIETSTAKILRYLEKRAGRKVNLKEMLREIGPASSSSARKNSGRKSRGKPQKRRRSGFEEDPALVLADLELLGLLNKSGSSFIVKKPFSLEARISFSPSGLYFGIPYGADSEARDLFIPPALSGHALPGDRVTLHANERQSYCT